MQYNTQIDLILAQIPATSPKQFFDTLAFQIGQALNMPKSAFYEPLIDKNKNKGAAIGEGIYIPYLKQKNLDRPFVALTTLETPVHIDSPDRKPVDIVCILLSPEKDGAMYLHNLSRFSRMLRNRQIVEKLREAKSGDAIRSFLMNPEGWLLAA